MAYSECSTLDSTETKRLGTIETRWEFIKENKKVRKQELDEENYQENNNLTKKATKKKEKTFSWSSSCFLIFFYKFPPLLRAGLIILQVH